MKTDYDRLTDEEKKRYDSLVARLEQLESDYLLHRIDVENYMRQRSLLIQKKNKIITKKEHDKVRYEFIKTYSI